jgi:hypothetical protein
MRNITFLCLIVLLSACGGMRVEAGAALTPPVTPQAGVLLSLWNEQAQRYEIRLVDPATGRDMPEYTLSTISNNNLFALPAAIAPDGQTLVAAGSRGQSCEPYGGGSSCRPSADELYFSHLSAGRRVMVALPGRGWLGPLAFHPTTSTLALTYHAAKSNQLMLFDTDTGQLTGQRDLEFRPSLLRYDREGTTLAIYGAPLGAEPGISKLDWPRLLLLDATTLEVQWKRSLLGIISGSWCEENCAESHEQRLMANWSPAVVFSTDGRKLYIVHADADKLTTVNFAAQTVSSVELQAVRSWVEEFLAFTAGTAQAKGAWQGAFKSAVLSADGGQLYVLGQTTEATPNAEGAWQSEQTFSGLQVIEVASGRKVTGYDTEAGEISLTADGAYLLLKGWGEAGYWTEVLEAARLERVKYLADWEVVSTRWIDGQPVILVSRADEQETHLALLDPQSFDVGPIWSVKGYAGWVAVP